MAKRSKSWQEIAHEAQALRDQTLADIGTTISLPPQLPTNITSIPEIILSEENIRITSLSPQQLIESIAKGNISTQEAVKAFLERAVAAQKLVSQLYTAPISMILVSCANLQL